MMIKNILRRTSWLLVAGMAAVACLLQRPAAAQEPNWYAPYKLPTELKLDRVDDAISVQVKSALARDRLVSSQLVDVSTRGGVVTLNGTVRSLLARGRAGLIAQQVPGVASVINDLQINPSSVPFDPDIRFSVDSALRMAGNFEFANVRVNVESGTVVLSGGVRTERNREWASQIAESVPGVTAVSNQLRVGYDAPPPDARIAENLRSAMVRQSFAAPDNVQIQVDGGRVALGGSAASVEEKAAAVRSAWAAGAASVDASALQIANPTVPRRLPDARYMLPVDFAIGQLVESALAAHPVLGESPIRVVVVGRTVRLQGAVGSPQAAQQAAAIAARVYGVEQVITDLEVRPMTAIPTQAQAANDVALFDSVRDVIETVPDLDSHQVTATVQDGVVSLFGTVESESRRAYVGNMVGRVGGVLRVNNALSVDPQAVGRTPGRVVR